MTGNTDSRRREPLFLLDESLVPNVARALALVDYKVRATTDFFGRQGVKDPEIIEWCGENDAVWIHADDRARKEHQKLLQTSGIRTLWVRRKRGAMTAREQLRILSSVLPRLILKYGEQPETRHYSVSAVNETRIPSLNPEEI